MILNRQRTVRVARPALQRFLQRLFEVLDMKTADLTVCLVSDAEIARLNEAFRKKKGPTDVLSFPAVTTRKSARLPVSTAHTPFLGDIAISPATARRNAKTYGRSLDTELRILVLHGVLHLLGYDHETDRGQMDRIERRLRRRFELR